MDSVSTMRHLRIVLVRTRFPENIGMAARAAANMGIGDLVLVSPERWDKEIATPLATGKGLEVLENIRIVPTLSNALDGCCRAFGATARTGGWRQQIMTPSAVSTAIMEALAETTLPVVWPSSSALRTGDWKTRKSSAVRISSPYQLRRGLLHSTWHSRCSSWRTNALSAAWTSLTTRPILYAKASTHAQPP